MKLQKLASFFPGWLFLLAMLTALSPLSVDLYLPAFPAIAESLNVNSAQIQVTLAAYLLGMAAGQLLYGPLSDHFGRKPPLYFGLALYVLASFACVFANDLTTLTIARFVQALGGSSGVVISRAVIRDRTKPAQSAKAFSMLMLALGLAPILAPLLGGFLLYIMGWRGIFAVLGVTGIVLFISTHYSMRETHFREPNAHLSLWSVLTRYLELLKEWQFQKYVLVAGMLFGGMFAYVAGSPFIVIELFEVPPEHFGWFFGINAIGMIAGSQINANLATRYGPEKVLKHVIWIPFVASLLGFSSAVLQFDSLPLLMLCFFAFMTSMGLLSPNAMALAMASQGHRAGSASAIMGAIQFLIGTLGATVISFWPLPNAIPLMTVMLISTAGSLFFFLLGKKNTGIDRARTEP
tara:strand:+ start:63 stop:1283 length:1221 start_codon:yes stop_codon:yes gene_type:complete